MVGIVWKNLNTVDLQWFSRPEELYMQKKTTVKSLWDKKRDQIKRYVKQNLQIHCIEKKKWKYSELE